MRCAHGEPNMSLRLYLLRYHWRFCVGVAIETPMKATLKFTVLKDKSHVKTPHFKTRLHASAEGDEYYGTTGVADGMSHISLPN